MALIKGLKKSGITAKTPKSLLLGAGTIYKNLAWSADTNAWSGTVFGATSGGNKFKFEPNIITIDVDGATVDTKGLTQKQGDTCQLDINLVEITPDSLKLTMIGEEVTSEATGFTKIRSKSVLSDEDYIDNIAFVGFTSTDDPIVIIMENALCTSGLELSGKNKENTVIPVTFKPYADFGKDASQDTLPVYIYYPNAKTANAGSGSESHSGSSNPVGG